MRVRLTVVAALCFSGYVTPVAGQLTGVRDDAAEAERGYVSAMKSDLRMLATAEEAYFVDHTAYFSGAVSAGRPLYGFSPSRGVTINVTAAAGAAMWTAVASHARTQTTCSYKLPEPIECKAPAPPALPSAADYAAASPSPANANVISIGDTHPVGIRPRASHKWEFEIKYPRTSCLAMGQIETLSGGDRNVSVVIVRDSAYDDWSHNRPVRTEYESGERRVVAFDVNINDAGRYVLVVSNSSTSASKVVQLQHVTVTCVE